MWIGICHPYATYARSKSQVSPDAEWTAMVAMALLLSHRPVGNLHVLYLRRLAHHAVSVRARLHTHQLRRGNRSISIVIRWSSRSNQVVIIACSSIDLMVAEQSSIVMWPVSGALIEHSTESSRPEILRVHTMRA